MGSRVPYAIVQTMNGGYEREETRTAHCARGSGVLRYVGPKDAWSDLRSWVDVEALQCQGD